MRDHNARARGLAIFTKKKNTSDLYQKLIAFQKRDGHTWPTIRDSMPRANALGNYPM
jgi:hypothetical protein